MRRTYVPPSGNLNAKLGLCGEQPGIVEIRKGKPFTGPAGGGLDECLVITKIPRHEIYLTNVIKDLDAPLKSYINIDTRGKWSISPEGYQYIHELGDEIKKLDLNVIVALGNVALLALCSRTGITKWRGSIIESTLVPGLKVIPAFHPATFIPPKFNFLNKPLICEDLLLAKEQSAFKEIRRMERMAYIRPSFSEAVNALNICYEYGVKGQIIGIDIEVVNGELDCISFGWAIDKAISIPFKDHNGDYFDVEQEYEIMLLIAKIIQEPKIAKVGANFIFDMQFLLNKYGIIPRGELHCTQIAQRVSFPDFSAGLAFVNTMYTDIPYYKDDGKQWIKMGAGSWEEWWNYSCLDGMVPVEASPKQMEVLRKQNNIETYDRQRRLIKPLIYMSERGIRVDVEGMMEYQSEQRKQLDVLAEKLNEIVGHDINYNSPAQLMRYFYGELGIKPYKKRNDQGKYVDTIDVNALKRISRLGHEAAKIMLDIRSLGKRLSTYLDLGKIDKDGRYRSAYKPDGAETGRIASGQTIFGMGGNQQNWPHDLLRFFLFDEGYIGYSLDLSQIENRIVAYVGGVIAQIEAFEKGIDLHRMTASIILGKPYDQISDEDGSSDLGDGRQSERYWGKKGNHATNYDVGYKTFALTNEMPEAEAKMVLERIHRGYPQIRNGYHTTIKNMLFKNRTVVNLFGRSRPFLGPVIPSYPNVPESHCIGTYRDAYAHLPQSTTADKMNEQGIEYTYYNQQWFEPVELLTQIHDSMVLQIPLSIPLIDHAKMLLMMRGSLETPLQWHGNEIKTPVDLAIGVNMCKNDMVEIKSKNIPDNPVILADKIKEAYDVLNKTKL